MVERWELFKLPQNITAKSAVAKAMKSPYFGSTDFAFAYAA